MPEKIHPQLGCHKLLEKILVTAKESLVETTKEIKRLKQRRPRNYKHRIRLQKEIYDDSYTLLFKEGVLETIFADFSITEIEPEYVRRKARER